MKNIFTLLFIFATVQMFAQIAFEQDFEDGMAPMTVVDVDGQTPNVNTAYVDEAWVARNQTTGNGTNIAVSTSWYTPAGVSDDWMITPAIVIPDSTYVLTWSAKAQDASFRDRYDVMVSTTDNELASFTDMVFTTGGRGEEGTFQDRGALLSQYAGETIYIAWRNNSNDKFLLYVDDILVQSVPEIEIAASIVTPQRFHLDGADVTLTAEITNLGYKSVNSLDLEWSDGTNVNTTNITGINLDPFETITVTHDVDVTVSGTETTDYTLTAMAPNGVADDMSNNTSDFRLTGLSEVPFTKILVEEGTGTWCQFCPRGYDWMEYMTENHLDKWVGIAMHNDDPMADPVYDAGYTSSPVFGGGFPGAFYNRIADLDPNQMEVQTLELKEIAQPVGVTTTASLDVTTEQMTLAGDANFFGKTDDIDYRFNMVLIEDGVTGSGGGWNQVNFYSGGTDPLVGYGLDWDQLPQSAPNIVYNDVGRRIFGGWDGVPNSIGTSVTDGFSESISLTQAYDDTWDPKNLRLATFVMNANDGTVLNVEVTDLEIICPTSLGISTDVTDEATSGSMDGAITVTPSVGIAPFTYAWANGESTASLDNLAGGDYQVVITDRAGCEETVDVTVATTVGTTEIDALEAVNIAPNPTSGLVNVDLRFTDRVDAQINVLNALGQRVETRALGFLNATTMTIDLSDQTNGIYYLQVQVGNQVHTERIVLTK